MYECRPPVDCVERVTCGLRAVPVCVMPYYYRHYRTAVEAYHDNTASLRLPSSGVAGVCVLVANLVLRAFRRGMPHFSSSKAGVDVPRPHLYLVLLPLLIDEELGAIGQGAGPGRNPKYRS